MSTGECIRLHRLAGAYHTLDLTYSSGFSTLISLLSCPIQTNHNSQFVARHLFRRLLYEKRVARKVQDGQLSEQLP